MDGAASSLARVLAEELAAWPVGSAGIAVVHGGGLLSSAGEVDRSFPWASVTKVLTALTVLHAADDGTLELDEPAGPAGATVRHLLAHASGLGLDTDKVMAAPGKRRIYSNRGIELAAEHLQRRAGRPFHALLGDRVLVPLGMAETRLHGSPAHGASGPVTDLARLAQELLMPRWFSVDLVARATRTAFEGLSGVLPGFGRQQSNDWGLGFEIRGHKQPHWMSTINSPAAFGHFGQSGSFLWVDPKLSLACVAAGDTPFGPWAAEAWPRLSSRILKTARPGLSEVRENPGDAR